MAGEEGAGLEVPVTSCQLESMIPVTEVDCAYQPAVLSSLLCFIRDTSTKKSSYCESDRSLLQLKVRVIQALHALLSSHMQTRSMSTAYPDITEVLVALAHNNEPVSLNDDLQRKWRQVQMQAFACQYVPQRLTCRPS
eukprot:2204127-Ditylum_brightwellii.AAC.1